MHWYRIELNEKGLAINARCVDDAQERDGGQRIYYFRALNEKSATQLAYREYHRVRLVARREKYRKLGKCKCGRDRSRETQAESAFAMCPQCRKLGREDHVRTQLKAKGLPAPVVDKSARFVDRRNEEKRELLEEVREQFLRSTNRVFGEWLNQRINSLTEKPAPKLRVVGNK